MTEISSATADKKIASLPLRGRLKIFLGYCAGVGKTYRMLQDSIVAKNNGLDVAIGLVETHGRVDTKSLVNNLEILPRKTLHYAGIAIHEMDLDAILLRAPQLVLVDEFAHTNIPGSRHAKRYQDVEELLNAGIDVYTTLNIQHVHSLVDIVYQITGVKIEETVPNWVLESADEIELVDLSPEKLQQRLVEGKVYIPQKAKLAMQRFFKKGNLLALRELSLKYTAKRVDTDLLSYRAQEDIAEVWPVESKLLVGIGIHKSTERVLLSAHRMATDLGTEWYAVHVESPQQSKYGEKTRNQLYRNISLAEELGAKVVALSGNNIADEIISFAKQKNVTMIITGLSQRSRWQAIVHNRLSVLRGLVKKANPINVLVVGNGTQVSQTDKSEIAQPVKWRSHFPGILGIGATFLLGKIFPQWFFADNMLMILLLPAIVAGILGGVAVGLSASLLSLGLYDLFFIYPKASFVIDSLHHLPGMALFILIVTGVSWIGRTIRRRADSARYRERFVYALYNFSREMLSAENSDEILHRALYSIVEAFDSDAVIMLPDDITGDLTVSIKSDPGLLLNDMEQAVAVWVHKNGRHAGKGTTTLSSAKWYYVPLSTRDCTLGVLCLMKGSSGELFSPEQKRLLEAFSGIIALALTRVYSK
jgi:two-component system sensor histidine kinase KdpD